MDSIEVEDLLEPLEHAIRGTSARVLEEGRHLALPARVHVAARHLGKRALEALGLEVAEQQTVGAQEERVVVPAAVAQRREHLGPDAAMALTVLRQTIRPHLENESDALHRQPPRARILPEAC